MRHGLTWYGRIQHGLTRCRLTRLRLTRHGLTRLGLTRHGLTRLGLTRHLCSAPRIGYTARMTQTDLLSRSTGDVPARAERPEIVRHTQGSHDVLLDPADPGGLSPAERAWIAERVAALSGHAALAAHYAALLRARDPAFSVNDRRSVILDHVTRVTTAPASATQAHIDALRSIGLTPRDIVALTQIVAFVAYQVRAAAGLALLARGPATGGTAA
jgi:uncharacterized protein YciW